jgi:hypothetical protein
MACLAIGNNTSTDVPIKTKTIARLALLYGMPCPCGTNAPSVLGCPCRARTECFCPIGQRRASFVSGQRPCWMTLTTPAEIENWAVAGALGKNDTRTYSIRIVRREIGETTLFRNHTGAVCDNSWLKFRKAPQDRTIRSSAYTRM